MTTAVPSGARVLLIDDDPVWRLLTASALHERGFEVHDLDSAADVAAQVDACAPDVVIVDAAMPGVDGLAACRMLRRHPRHMGLPILVMTGPDDEQAIDAAYQAGASDFFVKSTHWALLGERLRHLIGVVRPQRAAAAAAPEHGAAGGGPARDPLAASVDVSFEIAGQRFVGAAGAFAGFGLRPEATEMSLGVLRGRMQPTQFDRFQTQLRQAVDARQPFSFELIARPTSRQYRIIRFELVEAPAVVASPDGAAPVVEGLLRGTLTDITHTWEAQAQIRRLADCDPLTGLASRAQFLAAGAQVIQSARRRQCQRHAAVVVLNIDCFADVNERYGQSSGDELLCLIAARLADVCLPADAEPGQGFTGERQPILSRLAADCFAIMFPAVDGSEQLSPLIEQLQEAIGRTFALAAGPCTITASIGAAMYPEHGNDAGLLLSRADRAMSAVKSAGPNGICWYSVSLDHEGRSRIALASDLSRAIDARELELHYQPIVDVARRRLYGAEALMRWRKPGGLLHPMSFIPLAEETGLIIPMGEWAIGEASRQMATWIAAEQRLRRIAVNLPSGHFERRTLLGVVVDAIQGNGLPPGVLELELTETALVRDIDRTLPRFQALCEAGAAIAIDDFGTGYANLTYLARLPVDKLKIDGSFVQAMIDSPQAATIVRAIVGLGASLNMKVVAEGVETEAQAAALFDMGCTLMQGYLFARPVAGDEFVDAGARALAAVDAVRARASEAGVAARRAGAPT
ncbi:MAG: GGDEF domain-containing response regulator [Burkholderiaceae bacterium]